LARKCLRVHPDLKASQCEWNHIWNRCPWNAGWRGSSGACSTNRSSSSSSSSSNPDLLEPNILRSLLNVKVTSLHTSCAGCHFVAIDIDGQAWLFGRNTSSALGVVDTDYVSENAPICLKATDVGAQPGTKFVTAACGKNHTLLVGSDGSVWASGANQVGQVRRTARCTLVGRLTFSIGWPAPLPRSCGVQNRSRCACGQQGARCNGFGWDDVLRRSDGHWQRYVLLHVLAPWVSEFSAVFTFGSAQYGQLGNGATGERIITGNKTGYDIEYRPRMSH